MKDITPSSVTVRWSAPRDDGGADVTGYVVEKREASRRMWQSVGSVPPDVTELEAGGLFEGNQYIFRVTAENVVGLGEPAELKDSVIPKSQFGQLASTLLNIFISHQRNSYRYKRYLPNLSDNPLCPETL